MKLDFKKAKRKLFGSSPGKSKKKRGVRSGSSNGLDILCGVLIFAMLTAFTPMLLSGVDLITTNKWTTTTTASATNTESVLGLRRFKENLTPIEHNMAVTDQWGYFSVYVDLHFDIEPVIIDELGITVYGMTPLVNFTDNNSSTDYPKMVISATASDGSTERTAMSVDFSNGNIIVGLVVNVLSTANSTVVEWLLANTEPVEDLPDGAETITLKAGTYRFNDVLDLADLPYDNDYYNVDVNFTFPQIEGYNGIQFNFTHRGGSLYEMGYTIQGIDMVVWAFANGQEIYEGATYFDNVWHTLTEFGIPEGSTKYVALTQNVEVSDTFGTWFMANTNYNEVNAAQAAELEETQTVILNPVVIQYLYCFDQKRNFVNMAA